MGAWKTIAAAVCFCLILISGCGGDGNGTGNGTKQIVLAGRVMTNHSDQAVSARGIPNATVVLAKADDVAAAVSLSPVEDLASENTMYPTAITDPDGAYRFTLDDFSRGYPADGKYFVFVKPPISSSDLIPGGSASRGSLGLSGSAAVRLDIVLSDTNGSGAAYIGSSLCLICHFQQNRIKNTLHFLGIRKIGPDGTVTNGLMDMDDTSVYDLAANNDEMLKKFTSPATRYTFADDDAKSFWLGKDDAGFYFQLTLNTNPRFYIKYTYGGETGLWKGLFMTTVYAGTGTYAENHGEHGNDYAYYVIAPIQYNEDERSIYGENFVTWHAERWDFSGTANMGFMADPELNSFDLACSACHGATGVKTVNRGLPSERRTAVFQHDPNGYAFDGILSEMNVSCEKCHGPGSNHLNAGGLGKMIIAPDKLPSGRLTMICGSCHIRGNGYSDIGGGAALRADGNGNYETFMPGMAPAQFFGSSDGTGKKIAPFGTLEIEALTGNGYLEPVNFETNTEASWTDMIYGADFNHSKSNQQHYQDVVRSVKFGNDREILTCISCHDAHGSSYKHMMTYSADNNAVCLPCHRGPGQVFPNISEGAVNRLINDRITPDDFASIGGDVEAHIADKTGSFQMAPYDPEGTAMGRCTLCHMPENARSADWRSALVTQLGQYRHGDISSHTFDVMATESVNSMGSARGITDTTPAGISDPCGRCHAFAGLN